MEDMLNKYREQFGENFPLMLCMGMDEEDILHIVQQCMDDGEPYDPDMDPDVTY